MNEIFVDDTGVVGTTPTTIGLRATMADGTAAWKTMKRLTEEGLTRVVMPGTLFGAVYWVSVGAEVKGGKYSTVPERPPARPTLFGTVLPGHL